jgi:hypothetical protein
MVTLLRKHDDEVSLEEAKETIESNYAKANTVTKIKLKCWLYYCESRNEGGKNGIPFNTYSKMMDYDHYYLMVKGCTIDVSDLGGQAESLKSLSAYFFNK